jgi:predicted HD phosphohydrolase
VLLCPIASVDEQIDVLISLDGCPSDAIVAALPHLLQTAENLASIFPSDPELITAGLVHDVASSLDPECADHAEAGADLAAPLLGRRVVDLVAGHTNAKRYLVTLEDSYAENLSPGSTLSLTIQGGRMTTKESSSFRAH